MARNFVSSDAAASGTCSVETPGPGGVNLRAVAVTPQGARYVTTSSGQVFKQSTPNPWTPFGGSAIPSAQDILAVPAGPGRVHIVVAGTAGLWIAEDVADP